ncbi:DUF1214 domain-containing protein [Pseudohoeflea suaedae]|uniref:DUF1214 domain-containing protein n=1 Tax=Pseudohoeflea suaedae TaxID=877384 RepID=A0A4R5PP32_9HYPH|nr:DUF1214 domain-containing protein [Pseudohoeflea suaedae]TDH38834.1 DUF1214 domain-containing protein [Pseudohoeflea suaedae]
MFRLPIYVLLSLSIAFGGGTWASIRILKATSGFGAITVGPWQAFPELQTADADPYARAHRADDGRLLFGRAEGLVFTAARDSDGRALSALCSYRLDGQTPPARFWTLRVTNRAGTPVAPQPTTPRSLQSWRLLQDNDGTFHATIGGRPHPGNWISMTGGGDVKFVLTLLDTPTAASVSLGEVHLPDITREACDDA